MRRTARGSGPGPRRAVPGVGRAARLGFAVLVELGGSDQKLEPVRQVGVGVELPLQASAAERRGVLEARLAGRVSLVGNREREQAGVAAIVHAKAVRAALARALEAHVADRREAARRFLRGGSAGGAGFHRRV